MVKAEESTAVDAVIAGTFVLFDGLGAVKRRRQKWWKWYKTILPRFVLRIINETSKSSQ